MRLIFLLMIISIPLGGHASTCVYMNQVVPQAEIPHKFLQLDKDLDCNLTRLETLPDSELHDSFSSYDLNNDGLLAYSEVYDYFGRPPDSLNQATPMEDLDDLSENN